MYQLLSVITLFYLSSAGGQMCANMGKQCFSHSECCGGCCIRETCVESTRNCLLPIDDCQLIYCPPGTSCQLFQMPGCPGCPIVPYCREEGQQAPGEWS